MNVIELKDFSAYYKLKKEYLVALDHVDLTVEKGEFLTIVGPSGCGKTTLLKCILNQVDLTDGELRLMGKTPDRDVIKRAEAAYVSQDTLLYPHLNIFENIAFPLRVAELAPEEVDARVRAIAARCSIGPELLNRRPAQLSPGQQQRVALARAFIKRPEIILADEPFSHLDTALRTEFQALIRGYHEETGATVLFVTHDEEEAAALGDKRLRMGFGVIEGEEDTSRIGLHAGKKTIANVPEEILRKAEDPNPKRSKFLYRWPLYLLAVIAVAFLGSILWGKVTAPAPNEKLSLCLVGQDFDGDALQDALWPETGAYTDQPLRQLTVETLYNDNGTLLAETLTARILDGVDVFVLEEDYVFDGLGANYFTPIPRDTVDQLFPGAGTHQEEGEIYGIAIDPAADSRLSQSYSGSQTCWIFLNPLSENAGGLTGRGTAGDTSALDLAEYLWRDAP